VAEPEAETPVIAHFMSNGEEREEREVTQEWLRRAFETGENVLLADGNPYRIVSVELTREGARTHARVEVDAPQFTRAS
jgi:hypothetical protein